MSSEEEEELVMTSVPTQPPPMPVSNQNTSATKPDSMIGKNANVDSPRGQITDTDTRTAEQKKKDEERNKLQAQLEEQRKRVEELSKQARESRAAGKGWSASNAREQEREATQLKYLQDKLSHFDDPVVAQPSVADILSKREREYGYSGSSNNLSDVEVRKAQNELETISKQYNRQLSGKQGQRLQERDPYAYEQLQLKAQREISIAQTWYDFVRSTSLPDTNYSKTARDNIVAAKAANLKPKYGEQPDFQKNVYDEIKAERQQERSEQRAREEAANFAEYKQKDAAANDKLTGGTFTTTEGGQKTFKEVATERPDIKADAAQKEKTPTDAGPMKVTTDTTVKDEKSNPSTSSVKTADDPIVTGKGIADYLDQVTGFSPERPIPADEKKIEPQTQIASSSPTQAPELKVEGTQKFEIKKEGLSDDQLAFVKSVESEGKLRYANELQINPATGKLEPLFYDIEEAKRIGTEYKEQLQAVKRENTKIAAANKLEEERFKQREADIYKEANELGYDIKKTEIKNENGLVEYSYEYVPTKGKTQYIRLDYDTKTQKKGELFAISTTNEKGETKAVEQKYEYDEFEGLDPVRKFFGQMGASGRELVEGFAGLVGVKEPFKQIDEALVGKEVKVKTPQSAIGSGVGDLIEGDVKGAGEKIATAATKDPARFAGEIGFEVATGFISGPAFDAGGKGIAKIVTVAKELAPAAKPAVKAGEKTIEVASGFGSTSGKVESAAAKTAAKKPEIEKVTVDKVDNRGRFERENIERELKKDTAEGGAKPFENLTIDLGRGTGSEVNLGTGMPIGGAGPKPSEGAPPSGKKVTTMKDIDERLGFGKDEGGATREVGEGQVQVVKAEPKTKTAQKQKADLEEQKQAGKIDEELKVTEAESAASRTKAKPKLEDPRAGMQEIIKDLTGQDAVVGREGSLGFRGETGFERVQKANQKKRQRAEDEQGFIREPGQEQQFDLELIRTPKETQGVRTDHVVGTKQDEGFAFRFDTKQEEAFKFSFDTKQERVTKQTHDAVTRLTIPDLTVPKVPKVPEKPPSRRVTPPGGGGFRIDGGGWADGREPKELGGVGIKDFSVENILFQGLSLNEKGNLKYTKEELKEKSKETDDKMGVADATELLFGKGKRGKNLFGGLI